MTSLKNPQAIMTEYRVSVEQLSHCEMIETFTPRHEVFYLVESVSEPGTRYKIVFNREHHVLQCLPFEDGRTCPASAEGNVCWHKRAATAAWMIYKLQQRELAEQERREVESDPEYHTPEVERGEYEEDAESRELCALARDGARAYERGELHYDEKGRLLGCW